MQWIYIIIMPFLLKNGPNSNKVGKGHILPLKYATDSRVKWVPLKPQTDDYCRCFGVYTVAHDWSAVKWFYGIHTNHRLCTCVIECSAFDTTAFMRLRSKNQALEVCHIHSTTFMRLGPGVSKGRRPLVRRAHLRAEFNIGAYGLRAECNFIA